MAYKFLKDEKIEGKTIVLRVDLNSTVEANELFEGARIARHAQTIKELSDKGAKLVVLAHQGRKGQEDCISLKQHAEAITEKIEKEIKLLPWDSDYVSEIKALENGNIILMENTRFHENEEQSFSPEEASKIEWVQKIASCSNIFVQNALSISHRPQPSVVGFTTLLPSFVGPALEAELEALDKIGSGLNPTVFVLGGAKIADSISLMKLMFETGKADKVCVAGLLGELFLKAGGKKLGAKDKFFEEKNLTQFLDPAKNLLSHYSERIVMPVDVAIMGDSDEREEIMLDELPKENMIYDIGMETVAEFKEVLKKSKLIVLNGPMGMFEKMDFELGTKKVLDAVSKNRAFSLVGGGDTEIALQQAGFSEADFSHVSLAGRALLQYILGKELPGLIALQK